jgi:polyisoprenyl-teichoic acid--peptidoglycan teichoic acid transferase
MAHLLYRRIVVEDVHRLENEVRATRRQQRRALYRKRRLMGLAVLIALLLGIGSLAGSFFQGGGSFEPSSSVDSAGEVRTSSVAPAANRDSLEETLTTEGADAATDQEPTSNTPNEKASAEPLKASTESLYVLVLGVDRRPEDPESSPTRSDTMMLVKVTPDTGRIQLLSVPRDLLVEVAPGVEDRINEAYASGGIEQAKAVMENVTGISIDRYAIIDFEGFEEVINALDSVTLEVEQPITVGIDGQRVYIPAGAQELDGLEALAYARYRGTPCGDLDRIERQQQLVSALRARALRWNTITQLPRIVKVMNENIETDLGVVQAISIGRALIKYGGDGGMRSAQLKGEPEVLPNGDAVLVPDDRANESVLESFRNDHPKVSSDDRKPRTGGSSSAC